LDAARPREGKLTLVPARGQIRFSPGHFSWMMTGYRAR
jgi:hypothetical protein